MRCSGYRSNIPSERFRASLVEGEVLSHSASGSYKDSFQLHSATYSFAATFGTNFLPRKPSSLVLFNLLTKFVS
ncbi:unnamed protein product, partial [Larinioides sclopetarius]